MRDGYLRQCKSCVKTREYAYRDENRELIARRQQERYAATDPEQKRVRARIAVARRSKLASENAAARGVLNNALKTGLVVKNQCEVCGTTVRVEGHHDDYQDPLAVRWLCYRHHCEVHGKLVRVDPRPVGRKRRR